MLSHGPALKKQFPGVVFVRQFLFVQDQVVKWQSLQSIRLCLCISFLPNRFTTVSCGEHLWEPNDARTAAFGDHKGRKWRLAPFPWPCQFSMRDTFKILPGIGEA